MQSYNVVGVHVSTFTANSYKTISPDSNKILFDETRTAISIKSHVFTKYIVYVMFENIYYAIHLSEQHGASFGGRLYSIGNIEVEISNRDEIAAKMTHSPIIPLVIQGLFVSTPTLVYHDGVRGFSGETTEEFHKMNETKSYDYIDENNCSISSSEDPDTYVSNYLTYEVNPLCQVIKFSNDGGSERCPCGYAYVDMDLFLPLTAVDN